MSVSNGMNFNSEELLKFLVESGKVDLKEAVTLLRMQEKEKILETHPFNVSQCCDGRWKTRVLMPDGKRKMIAKKNKEDLLDALLDFYNLTPVDMLNEYTLTSLFSSWCEFKELHNASPTYMKRIKSNWNNYYKGQDIALKSIKDIKLIDCDVFAHKLIKKVNGSRKEYYNVSMIIRQMLDYAVELEIVDRNVFRSLKIKSRMVFTP